MPCFGSPALRFAPLSGGVWVRAWRPVPARPSSCFPTLSPRTAVWLGGHLLFCAWFWFSGPVLAELPLKDHAEYVTGHALFLTQAL